MLCYYEAKNNRYESALQSYPPYVSGSRRPILHQTPVGQGIWRLSLVMMLEHHLDWCSNDHGLLRIAE
jgi:hypothetical protein